MPIVAPYIAGIGCRAGCSEAELRLLLEQTLHAHGLAITDLAGLASVDRKRDESGLCALAVALNLPVTWLTLAQLDAVDDRIGSVSPTALRVMGAASVAEASALAQVEALSGKRAGLLVGKHACAMATVAVAGVEETL